MVACSLCYTFILAFFLFTKLNKAMNTNFSPVVNVSLPVQVLSLVSNTYPSLHWQRCLPNKFRQVCSQLPLLISHSLTSENNQRPEKKNRLITINYLVLHIANNVLLETALTETSERKPEDPK